jgi:hypothetical protein
MLGVLYPNANLMLGVLHSHANFPQKKFEWFLLWTESKAESYYISIKPVKLIRESVKCTKCFFLSKKENRRK